VKLLAFIFSFYILLLPAVPCSDISECNANAAATVSAKTCREQHQSHKEACSPFCSCACCGQIFTPLKKQERISYGKPWLPKKGTYYSDTSLCSNYLVNIWQPPKLS